MSVNNILVCLSQRQKLCVKRYFCLLDLKSYIITSSKLVVNALKVRSTLCFPVFLFIYRSSLSSNSPFRNWKILALCSLFFSAVSVTPMADTVIIIHGEQDPAIIIGRSVFSTRFILWTYGGGSHISKVKKYNVDGEFTSVHIPS